MSRYLILSSRLKSKVAKGDIRIEGDPGIYEALVDLIEPVDANFPVVTP